MTNAEEVIPEYIMALVLFWLWVASFPVAAVIILIRKKRKKKKST